MANVITLGLAKIELGDPAADGGMGTVLATLGYTYEDTCKMATDDPEITEFYAEEVDDPVVIKSKKGKTTLNFSIMNPGIDTLVSVLGGTKSGEAPNEVWNAPAQIPTINQSVKVTPDEGLAISIPNGYLTGKINGDFSRKGLFMIDVSIQVLTPTKAATAPITATAVAS